jgi:hypothetical protein
MDGNSHTMTAITERRFSKGNKNATILEKSVVCLRGGELHLINTAALARCVGLHAGISRFNFNGFLESAVSS